MHAHSVFELQPKLTLSVHALFGFIVQDFVLRWHLLGQFLLRLLYAETEVVLYYEARPEADAGDLVLVHSNYRVVIGETILDLLLNQAELRGRDVDGLSRNRNVLFRKTPVLKTGNALQFGGPLSPEQSTLGIFEVECQQQRIDFVNIPRVNIGLQSKRVRKHLSEIASVVKFLIVTVHKVIGAFGVILFEEFLELLQQDHAFCLIRMKAPAVAKNKIRVSLAFSQIARSLFGHLEAVVDAGKLKVVQDCILIVCLALAIHKLVFVAANADFVNFVQQLLVRRRVFVDCVIAAHSLALKDMLPIRFDHS